MALVTMPWVMTSPSSTPSESMTLMIRSGLNRRMRSSSSDRKKMACPGVALAAGASAQLPIDAPALVALGADDLQAGALSFVAGGLEIGIAFPGLGQPEDLGRQLDVRAAPGHVRGDGHGADPAGLGDDLGLHLVLLRVQHVVVDARAA